MVLDTSTASRAFGMWNSNNRIGMKRKVTDWNFLTVASVIISLIVLNAQSSHSHNEILHPALRSVVEQILSDVHRWKEEYAAEPFASGSHRRPFVTASFAQSLNGKIGFRSSSNYPLSCPESLILTHALRSLHDGILVGGRTLWLDNPRLTNRLWLMDNVKQPIPIVLDTHLTYIKRLLHANPINARNLIVCCSYEAAESLASNGINFMSGCEYDNTSSQSIVENLRILPCKTLHTKRRVGGAKDTAKKSYADDGICSVLDWSDVLEKLYVEYGIKSLMVEGGATILNSLFIGQQEILNQYPLVDALCVTIAPLAIDEREGVAVQYSLHDYADLPMDECGADATAAVLDWTSMSPKFYSVGSDGIFLTKWGKRK